MIQGFGGFLLLLGAWADTVVLVVVQVVVLGSDVSSLCKS